MKAQYNPPVVKDGSYEYNSHPYIEVKPSNEHYRMCYFSPVKVRELLYSPCSYVRL